MQAGRIAKVTSIPGQRRFQFDSHYPELMRFGSFSLQQIGDLSCDAQFLLSSHKQACYEISYIVSGKGWFAAGGDRHELKAGDIFICRPGEWHEGGASADDPFRYYYFGFHFHAGLREDDPMALIKQLLDERQIRFCSDRYDIRTPFAGALKELNSSDPFSQTMMHMYLQQLLMLTFRNFRSGEELKYPGDGREHSGKRAVYAAIQYIDDRLLHIEDLKEVSDAFGYSLSHLSHLFSKETGQSLRSYYVQRKWQKAVELMKERNYNLTEIAAILRYDSIHTFSRAFRRAFGLSPTRYMREHFLQTELEEESRESAVRGE